MAVVVFLLGLVGHEVLWVAVVNRVHGTGWARNFVESMCCLLNLCQLSLATLLVWWLASGQLSSPWPLSTSGSWTFTTVYLTACAAIAVRHALLWFPRHVLGAGCGREILLIHSTETVDVARALGCKPVHGRRATLMTCLPGNMLFKVRVEEKVLALATLPSSLEKLSIVHLSDFHFSGQIDPAYFHHVVRSANDFEPDLVTITGDICDFAGGLGWIGEILGGLRARHGIFCILGNHDLRNNLAPQVRSALTAAGIADVGAHPRIIEINGARVALIGNERPWLDLPGDQLERAADQPADFKILLSHSPDQLPWARAHGFQLMLSGHTHGGQICFPLIGPVACPSRFGIRYASGVFFEPPTALHVSRGLSSLLPLRLNCPPEITRLVLHGGQTA